MPDQRGGLDEERRNPEASQKAILDLIEELDFQNQLGWGTVVVFAKTVLSSVTDVVLRRKRKNDEIKERIKARTRVILEALEEEARLRRETEENTKKLKESNDSLANTMRALEKTVEQLKASNEEKAQKIKDLKAAQKALEEVTAMKDSILGVFSHDFRFPLENIVNILESFLRGDLEMETAKDIFPALIERVESLISKMNALLDIRRFEQGKVTPQMEIIEDPRKWMEDVLKNHYNKARKKGVIIQNDILCITPAFVSDKELLRRVIVNLVSNAIKFTEVGKTIRVLLEENDGKIVIGVSDEGVGMTDRQIENLWKFGSNISSKGTNKEPGSGSGMPLCYQIVTKVLKGDINVDSTYRKGTTFRVIIPELTTENVADYV